MQRIPAAILLLLLPASVLAQASAPTEDGKQVWTRARKIYAEQGPRDALPEFQRALQLFRAAGDRSHEAITLGNIGNCFRRMGDYPKSLEFHGQALRLKREIGDRLEEGKTLSNLGLVYWDQANYEKAISHFTDASRIAREIGDASLEGAVLNNLSLVYDEIGDYRRSLEGYQAALKKFRELGAADDESYVLGNLGGRLLNLGRFREAMHYYQQSLAISERLKLKQGMSMDLGNIGLCLTGLGQMPEAINHFDRALALAREAGLHKEAADWHKGKGSALVRAGRYTAALEEYQKATQSYLAGGLKRELIEALNDRGNLQLRLGDTASAENDFRLASSVSREIGHSRGVTSSLASLADVEFRRARFEKAAAIYKEAVSRARQDDDHSALASGLISLAMAQLRMNLIDEARGAAREAVSISKTNGTAPLEAAGRHAVAEIWRAQNMYNEALQEFAAAQTIAEPLADPELNWRIAYGRGRVLESSQKLDDAIAAYGDAVRIIESVRGQLAEPRFRSGYLEDKYEVYVALVQLLLKLNRPEEAFHVAEKLRARAYLEFLQRGRSPLTTPAGQRETELRERIRQLQTKVTVEQAKPPAQQKRQAMEAFSAELAAAERDFQILMDDLTASDPVYREWVSLRVPAANEIQSRLEPDTALVEYLAGEDSVAVFVVSRDRLYAKTLQIRTRELRAKVELLRDLIMRPQSDDWRLPAASLRELLLGPIEKEKWLAGFKHLIVVPHGVLHYVPFAALPSSGHGRQTLLAEEYQLSMLPAASALRHGPRATRPGTSVMALAPVRSRLRYAAEEARVVAANFPLRPLVLVGPSATEAEFKKRASHFGVLHFATHGYFNRMNPLFSGVDLEPGGGEDGRLEVHEILGMRLNAELVTLSACDTALSSGHFSEIPAGDDLVGLTRAFLFAGSPAVLATLWEVNDQSTLELMRTFYGQFSKGDVPAALAEAQRKMRNGRGRFRHPYYWAAFVLVGTPN